jgi:hypothetical protein
MPTEKERRQLPRVEVDWPITIFTDEGAVEGESKNITSDGLYINCDKPLPLNNIFRISIKPPHHQAIGVTGKIVWSDLYGIDDGDDLFGVGICLVEISEDDRNFLKDLISIYL